MSTTPEHKNPFYDQADSFLRMLKRLNVYSSNDVSGIDFKIIDPDNTGKINKFRVGSLSTRLSYKILPDTEAKIVNVQGLTLVPAKLSITLAEICRVDEYGPEYLLPFNSDIYNCIVRSKGEDSISNVIFKLYRDYSKGRFDVNIDTVSLKEVEEGIKWQVYCLMDSVHEDKSVFFVHFPDTDTWMAFTFPNITPSSSAVQVTGEMKSFVVDTDSLRYNYTCDSESFTRSGNSYREDEAIVYDNKDILATFDKESLFDIGMVSELSDLLIVRFKDDQSDPYLAPGDLERGDLTYLCGSEENLETQMRLVAHAAIPMDVWDTMGGSLEINVSAEADDEPAFIDYEGMMAVGSWGAVTASVSDEKKNAIQSAFEAILMDNTPRGMSWEYNDGPSDRRSGYSQHSLYVTVKIDAPSAHEQIGAKLELKNMKNIFSKSIVEALLQQ